MEKIAGYTTSVGEITRESGLEIGNSLKTIFSRITTMDESISALKDIGINTKEASGEMRKVEDVLDELGGRWNSLTKEQQQNLSVQLAGRNHLSKFLVMMNNYDQGLKATETALNSQGSAMRENEKHLQSYEAKINKVKNAWTEATLIMGEGFLGDSLVVGTDLATDGIKAFSKLAETIGLLPVVLGAAGIALTVFNGKLRSISFTNGQAIIDAFRNFDKGAQTASSGMLGFLRNTKAGSAASVGFGATLKNLKGAMIAFGTATVGALAPIAGLMALGMAISFITGKIAEAKQKQEDFKKEMEASTSSISKNKSEIDDLVAKYDTLSKMGNTRNNEQEEEYVRIQNELATLLPVVKAGEDSKGNAILLNADATRDYVAILEKRVALEKEKALNEAPEKIAEKVKEIAEYKAHIVSLKTEVDKLSNQAKQWESQGQNADGILENINQLKTEILDYEVKIVSAEGKLKSFSKTLVDGIKGNKDSGWISEQTARLNLDVDKIEKLTEKVKFVRQELGKGFSLEGIDASQLDKLKEKLEATGDRATWTGKEWKSFKDKLNTDGIENTASILGHLRNSQDDLRKSAEENNTTLKDSKPVFNDLGEIMGWHQKNIISVTDAYEENTNAVEANLSVQGELLEEYAKTADQIEPLNRLLEDMANGKKLSATEAIELIAQEEELANAISFENGQVKINKEAVLNLRDAKVSSYTQMLKSTESEAIATANATISNLNNYGHEIKAIKDLAEAKARLAEMAGADSHSLGIQSGDVKHEDVVPQETYNKFAGITDLLQNIESLKGLAGASLKEVGTQAEKAGDKTAKGSKKAEKGAKDLSDQQKKSKYIQDTYALSIANITYELKKQQSIQNRYPTHSKKYLKAVEEEIRILKEKKLLLEAQANDLDGQIKSGNITQYGVVTDDGSGYTQTSNSSGGSSWGGKYAKEINAAAKKYGVNPLLVAAIIKQESGFNPRAVSGAGARGLMQLMPGTARELGVKNSFNAKQNIDGGTKYIAQQLKAFGGNLNKALAAYNAGPGNVRKYGGIPPFKETQKYVKKVTANLNSFGGSVQQLSNSVGKTTKGVTSATNKVANYYLGMNVSSQYGENRGGTPHGGLDIQIQGKNGKGRSGDPVKALMGGKVIKSVYQLKEGNYVAIQQDDGKIARYMHMLNKSPLKAGQRVEAGDSIGKIGRTGKGVTGNHLHLQIEKNGKKIDPQEYLNKLSQGTAQREQDIDGAKMDLLDLKGNILDINDQLYSAEEKRQQGIIDRANRKFEPKLLDLEYKYSRNEELISRTAAGTKKYNERLKEQEKNLTKRRDLTEDQRNALQKLMKTEKFSSNVKDNLKAQINELSLSYQSLQTEIYAVNKALLDGTIEDYASKVGKLDHYFSRDEELISRETEGTKAYNKILNDQIKLLEKKDKLLRGERKDILGYISGNKLSAPDKKAAKEQADRNSLDIQSNLSKQYELNYQKLNSDLKKYNLEQDKLNYQYSRQEILQNRLVVGSKEYDQSLNTQLKTAKELQSSILAERNIILKRIQTDKLSKAQKEELIAKLNELSLAYQNQADVVNNINLDRANSTIARHSKELDKLAYTISRNEKILSRMDIEDGITKEYLEKQNEIIRQKKEEAEKLLAQRQDILKDLTAKVADVSPDGKPKAELENDIKTLKAQKAIAKAKLTKEIIKNKKELDKSNAELAKIGKKEEHAKTKAETKKLQQQYEKLKKEITNDIKNKNKEVKNKEKKIKELENQIKKNEAKLKTDYKKNVPLTPAQRDEKEKELQDKSLEYQDMLNAINDMVKAQKEANKQIADDLIQTWKDAYAKKKEIDLAAFDAETKAMDDAYDKKNKKYDEDLKAYEKAIADKIKEIDRLEDKEDYNKDIKKRNKEIAKIQNRIDLLSMDDSYEAQKEKAKLEEELYEKKEDLSDFQHKREVQLRKESLQDQLDAFKAAQDKEREISDETYKKDKEWREKRRKEIEREYDEEIANERKWAQIRKDILNGDVENVRTEMDKFLKEFSEMNENTVKEMELSWQELLNLIDKVNKAKDSLGGVSTLPENQVKNKYLLETSGFTDMKKAQNLAKELMTEYKALDAHVSLVDGLWKVFGEFESKERADKVLDRIKELGYVSTGTVNPDKKQQYEVKSQIYKYEIEAQKLIDEMKKKYGATDAYIKQENGWWRAYGVFDDKATADKILQELINLGQTDYGAVNEAKNLPYEIKSNYFMTQKEAEKVVKALQEDYGARNAYASFEDGIWRAYGSFDNKKLADQVLQKLIDTGLIDYGRVKDENTEPKLNVLKTDGYSNKEMAETIAKVLAEKYGAKDVKVTNTNGKWQAQGSFDDKNKADSVLESLKNSGYLTPDSSKVTDKPDTTKMYKLETNSFTTRGEAQRHADELKVSYGGLATRVQEYGKNNFTAVASFYSKAEAEKILNRIKSLSYLNVTDGKISEYHTGGIVGDKPVGRLSELANKLFNTKPNEQVIKSLKGELQIPPQNIPNIFENMKRLASSLTSQMAVVDSGVTINQMDVRIDNLQGGEQGAKEMFKHIQSQMVRKGRN